MLIKYILIKLIYILCGETPLSTFLNDLLTRDLHDTFHVECSPQVSAGMIGVERRPFILPIKGELEGGYFLFSLTFP